MGTSGGPGKIDSLKYGDQLAGMTQQMQRRSGATYRAAAPLYDQLAGQTADALRTGGYGSTIPVIARAVAQSQAANANAQRQVGQQLGDVGLAGTPFGQRIMGDTARTGALTASRLPGQIAGQYQGMAPGVANLGLESAQKFNALAAQILGQLQQEDLKRQAANAQQFNSFLNTLSTNTAYGIGQAAAACLHPDTPIATPTGPRPAIDLRNGDLVLTKDALGRTTTTPVTMFSRVPVGPEHRFVALPDGGFVSPTHPDEDGLPVGGTLVRAPRTGRTCDLQLADSETGLYCAGGRWLGSTLDPRHTVATEATC